MKIAVLVGNPKPESRTLMIAEGLADRIALLTGGEKSLKVDLADYASQLFKWPCPAIDFLNEAISRVDILIVGSPTYKAAYTGLLKAFLDRYSFNALQGVTAVPLMTT